eukprot:PLAT9445.1.p1 GENE.PLAT9445.1~~PLAT9445.1.p1  ORF type:complete len:448 (-),score=200.50 PLAT9445.1:394-1737(-)
MKRLLPRAIAARVRRKKKKRRLDSREQTAGSEESKAEQAAGACAAADGEALRASEELGHATGMRAAEAKEAVWSSKAVDEAGFYRPRAGDVLCGRYRVLRQLGKGISSVVCLAQDDSRLPARNVALKLVIARHSAAAASEAALLRKLEAEPTVPTLLDVVQWGELPVLVFAVADCSLRALLRSRRARLQAQRAAVIADGYEAEEKKEEQASAPPRSLPAAGLPLSTVRRFARQLFTSLAAVHALGRAHCDVKSDNCLLIDRAGVQLQLCDFGSALPIACDALAGGQGDLGGRFYRAPEVLLALPRGPAIDVWAAACVIYEMATARVLFRGRSDNGMLHIIQATCGRLPQALLADRSAGAVSSHFDADLRFLAHHDAGGCGDKLRRPAALAIVPQSRDMLQLLRAAGRKRGSSMRETMALAALLNGCLEMDAARRMTAADALRASFFV